MTKRSHKAPSVSKKPKLSQRAKHHLDELLDEALAETFPASDSPAMLEPAPGLAQAEAEERSRSRPAKRAASPHEKPGDD